jgi:hypothetical protein
VKVQLATLLGGTFCLWGLLAIPASFLGGADALVLSGVAAVLCLVPTTATLVWANRTPQQRPGDVLLLAVGGMGLRMTFVLGGAVALYLLIPGLHQTALWVWVLVFYLATLGLEAVLQVRGAAGGPPCGVPNSHEGV